MPYSTIDDLKLLMTEKDLLQCVDDERLGTLVGNTNALARVNKVIEWVDAEINSAARAAGYAVPLEDTALANSLSATLAMERLIGGRKALQSDARSAMFKQAHEQLTALAKSEIAPSDSASAPSKSEVQEGVRTFSRDTLSDL